VRGRWRELSALPSNRYGSEPVELGTRRRFAPSRKAAHSSRVDRSGSVPVAAVHSAPAPAVLPEVDDLTRRVGDAVRTAEAAPAIAAGGARVDHDLAG
jgi:hypothetical protein